jgi:regulator of RNase E activity RraA
VLSVSLTLAPGDIAHSDDDGIVVVAADGTP